MRCFALIILLIMSGCVGPKTKIPIEYQFIDIPEERRIELRYQNDLKYTVCLFPEVWPNQAGKIDQASDSMILVIEGESFPVIDFNTGYCPGCAIRVSPGEDVKTSVSYDDFNVPEHFETSEKILDFSPFVFRCREKK